MPAKAVKQCRKRPVLAVALLGRRIEEEVVAGAG
jgi:hypothetical protein